VAHVSTPYDSILDVMASVRSSSLYIVPSQLAERAREIVGVDHVIVSEYLPEGVVFEYRPPAGFDSLARPLPPMCTCGRRDGAAPIHTRRSDCPQ